LRQIIDGDVIYIRDYREPNVDDDQLKQMAMIGSRALPVMGHRLPMRRPADESQVNIGRFDGGLSAYRQWLAGHRMTKPAAFMVSASRSIPPFPLNRPSP
jgi:hypothetical protein